MESAALAADGVDVAVLLEAHSVSRLEIERIMFAADPLSRRFRLPSLMGFNTLSSQSGELKTRAHKVAYDEDQGRKHFFFQEKYCSSERWQNHV